MSIFYDTTTLLNKARQQQYSIQEEVKLLSESYEEVYEVDYEQLIDDLLDEGYSEEEVIEYLEEKMSDAEMRSLPARSRRRLGIAGPTQSKKGKKLVGSALQASIEKTRSLRQQRRASAAPSERQQKIAQKKSEAASRSSAKQWNAAFARHDQRMGKGTEETRSLPARTRKKLGVPEPGVMEIDRIKAIRASRRQAAPQSERQRRIAELGAKSKKGKPSTPPVLGKPKVSTTTTATTTAPSAAPTQPEKTTQKSTTQVRNTKPRETPQQRRERLGLNVGTRRSRRKARAERAAERRGASVDKSPRNRDLVMKGVKGGVEKYAKKVAGKIKKFFGKEDVNLIDATTYLLISEGYDDETIITILEWIESEVEADETYVCLEIVENVVDGAMIYNFMVENFEFEYEEDVYDVMEQLSIDDIEYIIESAY